MDRFFFSILLGQWGHFVYRSDLQLTKDFPSWTLLPSGSESHRLTRGSRGSVWLASMGIFSNCALDWLDRLMKCLWAESNRQNQDIGSRPKIHEKEIIDTFILGAIWRSFWTHPHGGDLGILSQARRIEREKGGEEGNKRTEWLLDYRSELEAARSKGGGGGVVTYFQRCLEPEEEERG